MFQHRALILPLLAAVVLVPACSQLRPPPDVDRGLDPLNVIDETNLSDIMLTAAAPDEAVAYFRRSAEQSPDRVDFQRGLATSLVRAGRAEEALPVWRALIARGGASANDRLAYAGALLRTGGWDEAEAQLAQVPDTVTTYERHRLEALIADRQENWAAADRHYETAAEMATQPAGILNNWGFSHLTRGEHARAEELFLEAITYDPDLFTAKNNLVLARAAQGNYQMPLIRMTQIERAQLLHTAGLAAVRRGEIDIGRGLLADAIDTHPQHFEAAHRALESLQSGAGAG